MAKIEAVDVVLRYGEMGWSVLALPPRSKKSNEQGWPTNPDDPMAIVEALQRGCNLGVRLGPRSGGLLDIDLDREESRRVAGALLPTTALVSGREGVPMGHFWYRCDDAPPDAGSSVLSNKPALSEPGSKSVGGVGGLHPKVATYVEVRWAGRYTVVAPSEHPEGGWYCWHTGSGAAMLPAPGVVPTTVGWDAINEAARDVAVGAVLLECYPEWTAAEYRHLAWLSVSGVLARAGWDEARVGRVVEAVAVAGGDDEALDRVTAARQVVRWHAQGRVVGGWPACERFVGAVRTALLKAFLGVVPSGTQQARLADWSDVVGQNPQPTGQGGGGGGQTSGGQGQGTQGAGSGAAPAFGTSGVVGTAQPVQPPSVNAVAFDIARLIAKQEALARDEGGNLYRYQGGVYVPEVNDLRLRQIVAQQVVKLHSRDYLNRHLEEEILHRLMVDAAEIEPRPNPWVLNVLNGVVDLNDPTFPLSAHDVRRRTTVQLPVEYRVGAKCPKIEAFFAQVFPKDAVEAGVPLALVALCVGALPNVDKAVLLLGEGENGKGVMLDIVKALAGHMNCCAVPLQRMGEDRFATSDLRGKLLNVCSDLPSKRLEDSGDFKAIVSGELIRAQRKNKPAFDFTPFCRLLFSANVLPESADTSWGYFRRWYVVPFTQTFGASNPARRSRAELLAEMTTPEELSGLLWAVLPWMVNFLQGFPPPESESMVEALAEFAELADPFPLWVRQSLAPGQGWIETAVIIQRYREKVERRGRSALLNSQHVGKVIAEMFPLARRSQRRVGGTGHGTGQSHGQKTVVGVQRWGYEGLVWQAGSTL